MSKRNNDTDRLAAAVADTVNGGTAAAVIDQSETITSDSGAVTVADPSTLTALTTLTAIHPPDPPPAPAGSTASVTVPVPVPIDLSAYVASLSPEQIAKLRTLAASAGISAGPRKGPNGGILIEVEVPAEVVEPFTEWASAAGESLPDFIRKVTADSLVSYCFQDWSAPAAAHTAAVAAQTAAAAATSTTGA
jgi:hypothetical protein